MTSKHILTGPTLPTAWYIPSSSPCEDEREAHLLKYLFKIKNAKFVDVRCPSGQSVTAVMLTTAETVAATSAGLNRHFSSVAT